MTQGVKQLCKRLLRKFGYEVCRLNAEESADKDYLAALTVEESQYYTKWYAPCPLFTPWVGHPDFQRVYEGIAPYTIVDPDHCYILTGVARYASLLAGDFAECGVYKGGTALLLCRILRDSGKVLRLFDSFKGLPKGDPEKDKWFSEGEYSSDSLDAVQHLLIDFRGFVDIRCGWIPQTFAGLENKRYAFAHLDVDLYQSALDCCRYFYPRMVPGGVMLFDEYGYPAARGEKVAVDEFFSDKPESPIVLPTGQAIVLKGPCAQNQPIV
jgi:O-methyltransferase